MENSVATTTTVETTRLNTLLERMCLPFTLKVEDGVLNLGSYRDRVIEDGSPDLPAYAGKTGTLYLGDSRVAEARLVDSECGICAAFNATEPQESRSLHDIILDSKLPVRVELGTKDVAVTELEHLVEGTIIDFGHLAGAVVDLMLEEPRCLLGRGEVIVIGDNLGIRIVETCEPELPRQSSCACASTVPTIRATFVLGSSRESLRDLSTLDEGSLVRLDSLARDTAKVILANGLVLEAEIVVVNENLAARIIGRYPVPAREMPGTESATESSSVQALVKPNVTAELEPSIEELHEELATLLASRPDKVAQYIQTLLLNNDRVKAALTIIVLGSQVATRIFASMHDDEIEMLTSEVEKLDVVESDSQRSALASLARTMRERNWVRPFDFLRRTDPVKLLNFIQTEHPQTIALILAHLERDTASYILQRLPQEHQPDILRRIATLDRTSPEVLREVGRVLEKKLSMLSSEDYTAVGGIDAIMEILILADRTTEKYIIESLEEDNPELADEIKKKMFVFEDIVLLDDRSIQKVIREVDSQDLTRALKGVDTEVQEKIFRNVSTRAVQALKEDMEYMGPVRIKDVEEAQQKIVAKIRHLEENGEIIIARGGDDGLIQ